MTTDDPREAFWESVAHFRRQSFSLTSCPATWPEGLRVVEFIAATTPKYFLNWISAGLVNCRAVVGPGQRRARLQVDLLDGREIVIGTVSESGDVATREVRITFPYGGMMDVKVRGVRWLFAPIHTLDPAVLSLILKEALSLEPVVREEEPTVREGEA